MVLLNTRDKGQYIFGGLSRRTFEVTVISVAKFLIACLVSDIFKDKEGQGHLPTAISCLWRMASVISLSIFQKQNVLPKV